MDKNRNECLDDFTFVMADNIEYPNVKTTDMGGVLPFNQYELTKDPTLRLVTALYTEYIF